jgi:hypothetical protein
MTEDGDSHPLDPFAGRWLSVYQEIAKKLVKIFFVVFSMELHGLVSHTICWLAWAVPPPQ